MRNEKKKAVRQNEKNENASQGAVRNVFDDLGFSSDEAENLKLRAEVMDAIIRIVKKRNYTQRDLQKLLDQPQPRVSELLNGKISKMSLEKLLDYLRRLGGRARLVLNWQTAA